MVRSQEVTRARDRSRLFARACSPNGGPDSSTKTWHEGLGLGAAPGGKSTQLAAYLANQGVLVSNEISSKRAKILVENMERFGATNVVVTNESADRLAKVFKGYFDVIVLDAPCSGEGMFRKQPDAMDYWVSIILVNVLVSKEKF